MFHKILRTDNSKTTIIIRLMFGVVSLSGGIQKWWLSLARGEGRFTKTGLPSPAFLGDFVGSFEIVCGTLILLGLLTRLASIPLIIIMLFSMALGRLIKKC